MLKEYGFCFQADLRKKKRRLFQSVLEAISGKNLNITQNIPGVFPVLQFRGKCQSGKKALEDAGVELKDVDIAEIYAAYPHFHLMVLEELGFCKEGEASRMIDEGETMINGRIPVNPSGGLAAKGHPVGATGLAQVAESRVAIKRGGRRQTGDPIQRSG
jgi:acetyl-CoA acetyltransferase